MVISLRARIIPDFYRLHFPGYRAIFNTCIHLKGAIRSEDQEQHDSNWNDNNKPGYIPDLPTIGRQAGNQVGGTAGGYRRLSRSSSTETGPGKRNVMIPSDHVVLTPRQ